MSDLNELRRSVEVSTLEREPEVEQIERRAKEGVRMIAGFAVQSSEARELAYSAIKAEREERIGQYRAACTTLELELAQYDVPVLCFVPRDAFLAMCQRAGLLAFRPAGNEITIDTSSIRCRLWDLGPQWLFPTAVAAILAAIFVPVPAGYAFFSFAATALLASIPMWLLQLMIEHRHNAKVMRQETSDRSALLRRIVFPLPRHEGYGDGVWVDFSLPTPPTDVQDLLYRIPQHAWSSKLQKHVGVKLNVACDPDAITFKRGLDKALLNAINLEIAAERRAWCDPIIFTANAHAVAIVAQFGDFPFERQVIDECLNATWRK